MRHQLQVLACAILAVTAAALAGPATASAQNPPPATPQPTPMTTAAFANAVGKKVYVTTLDGWRHKGRLQTVPPDSITLGVGKATPQIALNQVATIKRESHRMRNSMLIGLGAGVALFLEIGFHAEDGDEPALIASIPLGLGAGAGVGIFLNHLKRDSDLLFDRNRKPTTTVSLAPIVSPTRKGIALSVSWR
jgi:hypothetical protein